MQPEDTPTLFCLNKSPTACSTHERIIVSSQKEKKSLFGFLIMFGLKPVDRNVLVIQCSVQFS
jgi:hypothetical protein